jgi:hypothetical protein
MGSLYIPRLSEQELVDRYLAGESQGMLSLRAKKPVTWVATVLTRAGVPLRSASEAIAVSMRNRAESQALRKRRTVVFAPGTTGRKRRAVAP